MGIGKDSVRRIVLVVAELDEKVGGFLVQSRGEGQHSRMSCQLSLFPVIFLIHY